MILTSIVLGVVASVLAVELLGVTRWLARKLILRAVKFLPESERERWQEEWLTELEKINRLGFFLPQLWFAVSTYFGAPKLGMVLRDVIELDNKFEFLKFLHYLFTFNLLRLFEPLTFLLLKKAKDQSKKEKVAELFIRVRSYKFLVGLLIVGAAPRWLSAIAPRLFEKHIEKLLKEQGINKEVMYSEVTN